MIVGGIFCSDRSAETSHCANSFLSVTAVPPVRRFTGDQTRSSASGSGEYGGRQKVQLHRAIGPVEYAPEHCQTMPRMAIDDQRQCRGQGRSCAARDRGPSRVTRRPSLPSHSPVRVWETGNERM